MPRIAPDFPGYVDKIRLLGDAGERARAAHGLAKVIAGEPLAWFIGERRDVNDKRHFDTAYFFSATAVAIVHLTDEYPGISIVALRQTIKRLDIRPEHYWYGDPVALPPDARLSVDVQFSADEPLQLRASSRNIAQLAAIVEEFLLPNLRHAQN